MGQGGVACPKPVKGSARSARVQTRIECEERERSNKSRVRKLDHYQCRWPNCDCDKRRDRLEVAHVVDKSRGGSDDVGNLIVLCLARHQGRPSLHSGDLRIDPLTDEGTRGPCEFWRKDEHEQWVMVARERAPFICERD